MADPQHTPLLDGFDRLTVRLYRAGLCLVAVALLAAAGGHLGGFGGADTLARGGELAVAVGAALATGNMHLYDKRVRWVIGSACWLGVVLLAVAGALPEAVGHWVHHAGLGFVFVALSGFALKEQFCFRIPGLRLVPLFLAASLLPLVGGHGPLAAPLLGAAGAVYTLLAGAKLRMPLGHDVGDKARYQV